MGLRRVLLVLMLCLPLMGAATQNIQTMTSRPVDVDCAVPGTDGSVWYNTTTALLRTCSGGSAVTITTGGGGGGSAMILDLGNNASNESIALGKISTTGDLNGIFTEPFPDSLLIDATKSWPTADAFTSNPLNCSLPQFPLGVTAAGVAESCTPLPTSITGTPNQIGVSAPTGTVNLFIPANPIFPGTVSAGGFSGPLTGNVSGNVTGNVTGNVSGTASALATDPQNCLVAGTVPTGIDANGAAQGCFDVATQLELNAVEAAAAHQGGTSPCAAGEIFKTTGGLWACATDASGGGGGTPGGSTGQVQVNMGGVFTGDAGLTYNPATDVLTVVGGLVGPVAYSNLTGVPATLVQTNQANTYTIGDQSFAAAASLTTPVAAGASPTISGRLAYDSTTNTFEGGVAGVNKTFAMTDSNITGNAATATALVADGLNCTLPQFPLGVSATGAAQSCTPLPTSIAGTANQITASASTGAVSLSIPSNPVLGGTVTAGGFAGPLTGNATTATALAANAANCNPGEYSRGVDTLGAAENCTPIFTRDNAASLSAPSSVTVTALTEGIQGTAPLTDLSSTIQIQPGISGQLAFFPGTNQANTVKLDNLNGLRLCGNKGSTIVGLDGEKPLMTFNSTLNVWEELICPSLQKAYNTDRTIYGAFDASTSVQIGTDAANHLKIYGNTIECVASGGACDTLMTARTGKTLQMRYSDANTPGFTMSDTGVITYSNNSKPRKTVWLPAGAFETDQSVCQDPVAQQIVASGPKLQTISCIDPGVATAALATDFVMPNAWDGGDITVRTVWFSASNLNGQHVDTEWNGACVRDNDPVLAYTATGLRAAVTTFGNQANDEQMVATTLPITLTGTCAGGAHVYLQGRMLPATNAVMTNVRFLGIQVGYFVNAASD